MTQGSGSLLVQAVDAVFADAGGASIHALQQVSAEFLPGQLSVIVGPSGSGKSTLLHALAGIVVPQRGFISFGPTVVNQLDECRRDAWRLTHCGLLFQEFRLIEELDALANVLLPAQFQQTKMPAGMRERGCELLERFDVPRRSIQVAKMSRGEQQRVALARALAFEPEILLLDEPLSALDAQVRVNLREEIRRLQISLGTTTLFVTHDQEEAMAISDRVGVMNNGVLEQIDTPDVLYNQPATNFVASFVGVMNKIPSELTDGHVEVFGKRLKAIKSEQSAGKVHALIRPESIKVKTNSTNLNAKVLTRSFLGASSNIVCQLSDGTIVQSLMTSSGSGDLHPGSSVELEVATSEVLVTNG